MRIHWSPQVVVHQNERNISPYSRVSVLLEPLRLDGDGQIVAKSSATGFFWASADRVQLITNFHVVTGVNPETRIHIGSFLPNGMDVTFFAEKPEPSPDNPRRTALGRMRTRLSWDCLRPDDLWEFHSSGPTVDLAALSFSWGDQDWKPVCLNLTEVDFEYAAEISEEVFIVGYPEGQNFDRGLPLWKRGSVATDPSLDQKGTPSILC